MVLATSSGILDEAVYDVVLNPVHDERENEHDEGDLNSFVTLCPAKCPVANPGDPRQDREEEEDAELHAEKAEKVDERLLEPPAHSGWLTVNSRFDGLGWVCERSEHGSSVEEPEKDDKYGNADSCLFIVSSLARLANVEPQVELTSIARFKR